MKRLAVLLSLALFIFVIYKITHNVRKTNIEVNTTVTEGAPAPDFTLKDVITNNEVSLSDFSDNVIILDFWATWCPPCRAEIPHFIELVKEYGEKGLVIVGIALDESQQVQEFYKANKMNYPVLVGTREIQNSYGGITAIPTTFIIDRNKKIRRKVVGYQPKEFFEREIKNLLEEEM